MCGAYDQGQSILTPFRLYLFHAYPISTGPLDLARFGCARDFVQVPEGRRLHPGGDLQHAVDQSANLHQPDRHDLFI